MVSLCIASKWSEERISVLVDICEKIWDMLKEYCSPALLFGLPWLPKCYKIATIIIIMFVINK